MRREYLQGIHDIDMNDIMRDLAEYQKKMESEGHLGNYSCILSEVDEYGTIAEFTDCPASELPVDMPMSDMVVPGTNGEIYRVFKYNE